jgi:cation transport ATPase
MFARIPSSGRKPFASVSVIGVLGVIEIRAERIGRDTSYGKIIEAVERAGRSRAPCAERSAVPAPVAMPA